MDQRDVVVAEATALKSSKERAGRRSLLFILLSLASVLTTACEFNSPAGLLCGDPFLLFSLNTAASTNSREGYIHRDLRWRTFSGANYSLSTEWSLAAFCQAQHQMDLPVETKLRLAVEFFERNGWPKVFRQMAQEHGDSIPEVVAAFVQGAFPYQTSNIQGLLPIQLGVHGAGDCDDKSITAVGLLGAAGFTVAYIEMIRSVPHALLGIKLPDNPGWGVDYQGTRFTFWELTQPGHRPGFNPFPDAKSVIVIRPPRR